MKWYVEDSLSNFKFWGQAAENVKELSRDELDRIGDAMEAGDYFGSETPEEVEINDIFAYDFDFALSSIGYRESPSGNIIRSASDLKVSEVEDDAEAWLNDNGYEDWSNEQLRKFCELAIENEHLSVGGEAGEGGSFEIEFEALAEDDADEAGIKRPWDDEEEPEKVESSARRTHASHADRRHGKAVVSRAQAAYARRPERKFNFHGKLVTASTKEQAVRKIMASRRRLG